MDSLPKSFPCNHTFFSGATVTLDAPLIVPEQNQSFLATINLTGPSGGTTIPLEIDINDIGITAMRFGMFNFEFTANISQYIISNKISCNFS